ncbi:hypothetical protein [Saccharopolyspora spinosa]|uniref:Secreted protein n=1 Tax=Saccharopolyspora spinosa TaxID=60894 RepID=A0A2N3Y874_SACSN|nr:hypothetical protein [Saccharopolyspora spinosa]PKW19110.1 hypothetical protein A8926_7257 [Saccharopolyspora spinosa]
MRGKAWRITRAGLFLLLAVVLALLGPLNAEAGPQFRTGPGETKSETNEHRDGEKLRERVPGIALYRRCSDGQEGRRPLLPRGQQHVVDIGKQVLTGKFPNARSKPHDAFAKVRHSPAVLQVVRH